MLQMTIEEREEYLKLLDHDTLLYMLIPYFDYESEKRKTHSRKVIESRKRKLETSHCRFSCDWEAVKSHWSKCSAATTVRNYQTAHMQWTELAASKFPGVSANKLLIELVNNPEVIEEYCNLSETWGVGTKADRIKYLLNLNDQYPNFKEHTLVEKVSILRDMKEYFTLVQMEEAIQKPPSIEPVMSYYDLQKRVCLAFGANSLENLFVRTMLEIPVRGDLSTMMFYRDEETAIREGGN